MKLKLVSSFHPTGDQPQAINQLTKGIKTGLPDQVLHGVTGSGKTFTIANVIKNLKIPTLVISHNKTLAAQLYQEFRDFFPVNAISYFVSYYDYYQPEAYIPRTDTYIEKETEINEELEKLRLAATTNIMTRKDIIVVASVSCIYNLGSPKNYLLSVLELKKGNRIDIEQVIKKLVNLQYQKSGFEFLRGTFRTRGEYIDIFPAYADEAVRIQFTDNRIIEISIIDPISGKIPKDDIKTTVIYPAKHFQIQKESQDGILQQIRRDLKKQVIHLKSQNKKIEAERLTRRVNYDLEMMTEVGYVNGIENYSRYFDQRTEGAPPYTLLDYFKESFGDYWLLVIDESHQTIPQLNGMYNGDRSRKQTLIDFGFRLPSALDNRPLKFSEFLDIKPQTIYVSATPGDWELYQSRQNITRQFIRPTGIVDPKITVRPSTNQIVNLTEEIIDRKKKGEKVLVTTLTKRIAEDLAQYFNDKKYLEIDSFKSLDKNYYPIVTYLHSDIITLERSDILDNLRLGKYDCLIGINLLREGLDLPEVSLVAILDADKEGFLRSSTSLIQTMGRAARHTEGTIIMYADKITRSMKQAISEIEKRRNVQLAYNKDHKINPVSIIKPVREKLIGEEEESNLPLLEKLTKTRPFKSKELKYDQIDSLTPFDKKRLVKFLEREMREAASILNFERAAQLRDKIKEIKSIL